MRRNREIEDGMGFRGHAPPRRGAHKKPTLQKKVVKRASKPAKQSERTLHMHCQQWLEKSGWWAKLLIFHVPNERRGGFGAMIHFKRLGVRPGVADYLMFGLARDAAIELKDRDGEQSTGQETFEAQWRACGKVYFVIRTLEDFQATVVALAVFG